MDFTRYSCLPSHLMSFHTTHFVFLPYSVGHYLLTFFSLSLAFAFGFFACFLVNPMDLIIRLVRCLFFTCTCVHKNCVLLYRCFFFLSLSFL